MGGDRPPPRDPSHTVRRWKKGQAPPNAQQKMALLDLAEDLGLGHLFTDWGCCVPENGLEMVMGLPLAGSVVTVESSHLFVS